MRNDVVAAYRSDAEDYGCGRGLLVKVSDGGSCRFYFTVCMSQPERGRERKREIYTRSIQEYTRKEARAHGVLSND